MEEEFWLLRLLIKPETINSKISPKFGFLKGGHMTMVQFAGPIEFAAGNHGQKFLLEQLTPKMFLGCLPVLFAFCRR